MQPQTMPGQETPSAAALAGEAFNILKDVLPKGRDFIPLHEPIFNEEAADLVADCVRTGWVSSVGKYVDQFEKDLAEYCGVKHAIVAMNGTAALHICLKLAGVESGDEVLCPSLTFVATANAIHYCYALPHFVDVEAASLGVCPVKLKAHLQNIAALKDGVCYNKETNRPIRALVVMHCFGLPCQIRALKDICDEYNITLVEDAAESLGAYENGVHTGNVGTLSAVSFNGNKIMTTGGGGAILTNDADISKHAKHITTTAKRPHAFEYVHDEVGYNYRMPNLNAALGVAQLKQMPAFLQNKRDLHERYSKAFAGVEGIELLCEPENTVSNYWLNAVRLPDRATRDAFLEITNKNGIMTRPIWQPMDTLPVNAHCPKADLSVTEEQDSRIVNIPSSANLL
jgi:perosamine synthetase